MAGLNPGSATASSHREAAGSLGAPQYDNTDTYAFVSPDKSGTVTLIGAAADLTALAEQLRGGLAARATARGTPEARLWLHRGLVEATLGLTAEARTHLDRAVALDGGAHPLLVARTLQALAGL